MSKFFKKIIAREGLVILLILLIDFIVLIIPDSIVLVDIKKPIDLLQERELTVTDDQTGIKYTLVVTKDFDTSKEFKEEQDITRFINAGQVIKKEITRLRDKLFFIFLLIYPIYLLVRFIIWAIKTLREK